jgi:rhodanese-related sulfurtransferase
LAAALATGALVVIGAAGCGSDADPAPPAAAEEGAERSAATGGTPSPGVEAATAALDEGRVVIDVRTAEEFDAGHVEGAERIGLADTDFAERIADLDPDEAYVVYCRSGNRSAQAASVMTGAGLDVVDGGALTDMAEAGWPTVGGANG